MAQIAVNVLELDNRVDPGAPYLFPFQCQALSAKGHYQQKRPDTLGLAGLTRISGLRGAR